VEKTNTVKNGKRQGHTNNHLMKAKRSLDEAIVQLSDFPQLRERVATVREEVLQAFVAYSGDRDRAVRRIMIMHSADRDRSSERSDARDCLLSLTSWQGRSSLVGGYQGSGPPPERRSLSLYAIAARPVRGLTLVSAGRPAAASARRAAPPGRRRDSSAGPWPAFRAATAPATR